MPVKQNMPILNGRKVKFCLIGIEQHFVQYLVSDMLPVVRASLLGKAIPQGRPHTNDPEYNHKQPSGSTYLISSTHTIQFHPIDVRVYLSAIVLTSLNHSSLRAGLVITWEDKVISWMSRENNQPRQQFWHHGGEGLSRGAWTIGMIQQRLKHIKCSTLIAV